VVPRFAERAQADWGPPQKRPGLVSAVIKTNTLLRAPRPPFPSGGTRNNRGYLTMLG